MACKAVFIGVNRHVDPAFSELVGARTDATALWALFSDTLEGLSTHLLLDDRATHEAASKAILSTLSSADAEDVVVITFAGHGTPDGRLAFFDTDSTDLPGTALSMTVLAESFKSTPARAVLLILDCCFSGQAPARVLETASLPRTTVPFTEISGEGRILLAACATNEAAWEQPGSGHGLLTYSVIRAMSDAPKGISFPEIAGEIIRLARVEGERIGVTQTPVFLGSVEGGLTFPTLRRGENFNAAFPPAPVHAVGSFADLKTCGFPSDVVDRWSIQFPDGLNDLQKKAVNERGVLAGSGLLVVAPTSSGKTMIGELAAVQAVAAGKKAAFLLPYRALVNEKFEEFGARYAPTGIRVVRCSGDASDGIAPTLAGRYDLGFFTYETFLNMALGSPRLLNQLGLIVVDEGQFITDPNRGIVVELILTLLLRARRRGIEPQLIVLSAVIGKLNSFDRWLDLPVLTSRERPVPLIEGVLDRRGTFQFVDADGSTKTESLLSPHEIVQRRDKPSSQDVIVPLARKLVASNEKLLVFRNVRGPAQGCARYLSKELGLGPVSDVLKALPTQDLTAASRDLRDCLLGGTAFHNTNLLRSEREAVERAFRDPKGDIKVLAATTTLAAGINTPASTVILAENEFLGEDGRPFTVAEYKNMAGRAGRLGFNEIGKAIILAANPVERAHLFQKYVLGTPEDVTSAFKQQELPTWILRLLSQVRGIPAADIPALLVNTFGGYSASKADPRWIATIETEIGALITRLLAAGLAEMDGDSIHLTLLGRACGNSSLSFESGLRLIEMMRSIDAGTTQPLQMLAIIQVLDEMDAVYTPVMRRGRSESQRISQAAQRYGAEISRVLQRYCPDEIEFWRRCKRAAILGDWVDGEVIEDIERRYTTNVIQGSIGYGDIARIADSTRFHLRSAHQIVSALFPNEPGFLAGLDEVLKRLEFGLPADAIGLTSLWIPLTRGQLLALSRGGCKSIDEVKALPIERLIECVGAAAASSLHRTKSGQGANDQPVSQTSANT